MVNEVMKFITEHDPEVGKAIEAEYARQKRNIELIASENIVSEAVMMAMGTVLTNKYAEGYPGKRYYGGCQYVDIVENIAIKRACELFKCNYANVQPHSGAQANTAVYLALLKPGDTVMGMSLDNGGHLSHGSPVNISGKIFNFIHYGANKSGWIDTNDFIDKLYKFNPKLVVIGASAYSRTLYFDTFRNVIDYYRGQTGNECYMLVDMAHIAGLVAAGDHPSPFGLADIITTTTHKTLRGTRGGLIFCKPELAKRIDSAVFPCCQGGALQHIIAGKAVTAEEACTDKFKNYIHAVVRMELICTQGTKRPNARAFLLTVMSSFLLHTQAASMLIHGFDADASV